MTKLYWPYPGARWWKFDFHTHTPASKDTYWAKNGIDLSPEDWLHYHMNREIDCVVVTDHNSGAWIDRLKHAYAGMKEQHKAGNAPDWFREITIFPGVEISVNSGFHLLAIFGPSETRRAIDDLLATVRYEGNEGESDGVTRTSPVDVVQSVLQAGGIPIPAHADQVKGLLQVNRGTRECFLDANTVRQVMDIDELLAVEWLDPTLDAPDCVAKPTSRLTKVVGSDCHNFQSDDVAGSRHTWVKMASPTLEGLRLALLDGNGVSVRRGDEGAFEPFRAPTDFITRVEIEAARFMGNGEPECLNLTPFYNAVIGGRGTGKSTIVHAMRMAYRREDELKRLGEGTEPYRQFAGFAQVVSGRNGDGALRDNTVVRVELVRDGVRHRLQWHADNERLIVEEQGEGGTWQTSHSQAVTADRFPLRLFSQGQIAAMAGESRQALLDVIDEAADVGDLHRELEEAKRSYFAQRAQLRDLNGRLEGRPEVERKLGDLNRKLEALAQSDHAQVLKTYQQALRQRKEVDATIEQLRNLPLQIQSTAQNFLLADWPQDLFDAEMDQDTITWRTDAERAVDDARGALEDLAEEVTRKVTTLAAGAGLSEWRRRADEARDNYERLQVALAGEGVTDPQAFGKLADERQHLEGQLNELGKLQEDRERLEVEAERQWKRIIDARGAITNARREFVAEALAGNEFVRIEVVSFGFDPLHIERSLRDILNCPGDRFESDILTFEEGEAAGGLAFDIAVSSHRGADLERVKTRLVDPNGGLGGHFRNFLQRNMEAPEYQDRLRAWFPEDDLRIEYSRTGDGRNWAPITQGSQGQRSAALLAFLLAFGEEPMILDQPEDDLDNHLIYELIVRQIRENKLRRQLLIVTHNPNVVVNGDAEMVQAFDFRGGQCRAVERGALQERPVREQVCRVMEGGLEAFERRWKRLGRAL
jgi:hypothetical protein